MLVYFGTKCDMHCDANLSLAYLVARGTPIDDAAFIHAAIACFSGDHADEPNAFGGLSTAVLA